MKWKWELVAMARHSILHLEQKREWESNCFFPLRFHLSRLSREMSAPYKRKPNNVFSLNTFDVCTVHAQWTMKRQNSQPIYSRYVISVEYIYNNQNTIEYGFPIEWYLLSEMRLIDDANSVYFYDCLSNSLSHFVLDSWKIIPSWLHEEEEEDLPVGYVVYSTVYATKMCPRCAKIMEIW